MKTESFDATREKMVLTNMITDTSFLSYIVTRWDKDGLFSNNWSNVIAGWCVEHYRQFQKAPRDGIKHLYEEWAARNKNETTAKMVDRFLAHLSDAAPNKRMSLKYLLDIASKHFNAVKLGKLVESVNSKLEARDIEDADKTVREYRYIKLCDSDGVDIFRDEAEIMSTFEDQETRTLIKMPGVLELFYLNMLERGRMICYQAPEKSGKTFMLVDMAVRALEQQLKVAFFAVGDMTLKQMKERFYVRVAKHPSRSDDGKWPFTVQIPVSIKAPAKIDKLPIVEYKEKVFERPLDGKVAYEACKDFITRKMRTKKSKFRMAVYPNDTISILGVRDQIRAWELEGFVPDVICIDYADILAPINHKRELRDQIDDTWKRMKSLCQEYDCLLLSASQAKATAYKTYLQDSSHFSGNKLKNAHVDGMCGINVSQKEREHSLMRLNWTLKRTGRFTSSRQVYCVGCLALGCPVLKATF